MLAASLAAAAAVGWPDMYPQCFPPSLSSRFMGQSGTEDHGALAANPGTWTASCSHGVLMRGGTFPGAVSHGGCDGVRRYRAAFGTRTVTLLPGYSTVEMVCAHLSSSSWSYASSTGRNELDSAPVEADVLVVGTGLGGHAAAGALQHYGGGTASHVMVSPGSSTSARSTGVVWFPLNHTYAELQEASGFDETDAAHIEAYLSTGAESYAFWKAALDLQAYPAPDYTTYSTGAKFGNTFQAAACTGLGTGDTCGAATLLNLSLIYSLNTEVGTVTGIQQTRDGFEVQLHNSESKRVRAVVFANGGSGRYNNFAADRILAGPENTGVHMTAAASLGLAVNGRNLSWGLEFEFDATASQWKERWFSFGCGPAGVAGYAKCGDYNTRTLSWPDDAPRNSTVYNVSACTSESASYAYWRTIFDGFIGQATGGLTAEHLDALLCSNGGRLLAAGMIDGKDGFLANPNTMESVAVQGLYAAGTAGAYGLGNTYFGPGATLGWALHSGRLAGKAAAALVADRKRRDAGNKIRVSPKGKSPTIIRLFRIGTWMLLAAVAFHVEGSLRAFAPEKWKPALKWTAAVHYVLAPMAVAVVLVAAWQARGQAKRDRVMPQIDSQKSRTHVSAGRAMAIVLLVQVAFGIGALLLNTCSKRNLWVSWIHRLTGWYALFVIGGLYWTSLEAAPLHDDGVSKKEHEGQAMAYSWITIGLFVFALATLLANCCAARRPAAPKSDFEALLVPLN